MLYVIETNRTGAVIRLTPCEDGIDQAIEVIADRLTDPEEDWRASCDVVSHRWTLAIEAAAELGRDAHECFSIERPSISSSRFGLAAL